MLDDNTRRLFGLAAEAGRDIRPGRAQRRDGWTPDRIRIFLHKLSQGFTVAQAAEAAGKTPRSAYLLRSSAKGRTFDLAWRFAQGIARERRTGPVRSRVIDGQVKPIIRNGKIWGVRHRPDNRLTMTTLTRLDKLAQRDGDIDDLFARVAQDPEQLKEFAKFARAVFAPREGNDEWQP